MLETLQAGSYHYRTMKVLRICALLLLIVGGVCLGFDEPDPGQKTSQIFNENYSPHLLFEMGGWSMWPLTLTTIVGVLFVLERAVMLRRSKHVTPDFHKTVIKVVDTRGVDSALALCLESKTSLSRVLYAALLRYGSGRQEMEWAVIEESRRVLYDLYRNSGPIGLMCITTPLLGLLGLCTGLLVCLDDLAALQSGYYSALSAGVSHALIPLIFALASTSILSICYYFMRLRAADIAREVEECAIEAVVTLDRKARQSIRLIDDIEEQIETQDMPGIKARDLDKEFEDKDHEGSGLKTSITTHAGLTPVPTPVPEKKNQNEVKD
jgi:biopolymer transport protein ExbB